MRDTDQQWFVAHPGARIFIRRMGAEELPAGASPKFNAVGVIEVAKVVLIWLPLAI